MGQCRGVLGSDFLFKKITIYGGLLRGQSRSRERTDTVRDNGVRSETESEGGANRTY